MAVLRWRHPIAVAAAVWLVAVVIPAGGIVDEAAAQSVPADADRAERGSVDSGDADSDDAASRYDIEPRDLIDGAAPVDSKLAKLLEQAETLLVEEKWERAQRVLLVILSRADDAMVRQRDGQGVQLVPAAVAANQLLGELPESSLELYRRRYGPAAQNALATAIAGRDREALEHVAVQFRHTEAGGEAIRRIASLHFDRAEFGLAAVRYRQLRDDELEPATRIRAAFSFAAVGNHTEAERLVAGLTDSDRDKLRGDFDLDGFLAAARRPSMVPRLDGWLHPQGHVSGTGIARAGEPVLLRRWSHPLTDRPSIQKQIDEAEQELHDEDRATIPAAIPLAIDDVTVSRTLRGIAVHSLATGQLLWEASSESSDDGVMSSGMSGQAMRVQAALRFQIQRNPFGPNPSFRSGEHKPLSNRLYRDGVHGFLTSDGERVFAVEDLESGTANRLVAYDLRTGRPAWPEFGALGGLLTDGPFVPPLAGHTFFGPPVPAGKVAYVIGEKEKEIRLIAIDTATGGVRWDRLIAHAQAGIDQDPVRLDWPALPALADGVLVCPTTVGWVVGVDRSSHAILWAYRYAPPQSNRQTDMDAVAAPAHLNHRWCPSTPIIGNGRVVLAPAEEAKLICLDLYTGELIWQLDKGRALYTTKASDDLLVTVGTDEIAGIELETGTRRWELPIPADVGLPSGRAIVAGKSLYVPLQENTLWQVDVASGKLQSTKRQRPGEPALGNLVLHRGTLLSYSTAGLTAFEERTELTRQTQQQLQADPGDVDALLQVAALQHSDGDATAAAKTLDRVDLQRVGSGRRAEFQRLRWDVLETLARSDRADARKSLSRLATIAETSDQQLTVRQLEADRASADGDVEQAARAYLSLLTDVATDSYIAEDSGRRQVRLTAWLAGRFADLWAATDDESRISLDELIRNTLSSAADDGQRRRLATIFAFHPAAVELRHQISEKARLAGRIVEAESPLLRLARRDDGTVAAAARLELAATADHFGLVSDARAWRAAAKRITAANIDPETTATDPGSDPDRDSLAASGEGGETEESQVTENADESTPDEDANGRRSVLWDSWGEFELSVVRAGGYTSSEAALEVNPGGGDLPYYRDRRLQLLAKKNHLAVSGPGGKGLHELIPIRSEIHSARHVISLADGHQLFLLFGGIVQAISPVEGRVLWTASLPDRTAGFSRDSSPEAMRPAGGLTVRKSLLAESRSRKSMPAASSSYVAVLGHGDLVVRDSLTGDIRWSRSDLPHEATIVGTDNYLFVHARESGRRAAYRAIDGKTVPLGKAAEVLSQSVAVVGDRVLSIVAMDPPFRVFNLPIGRRTVVSLKDPRTGQARWTRSFSADTLFDVTVDGRLYALVPHDDRDGELIEIASETGETTLLGSIPAEVLRKRNDAYLLADAGAVYVIINYGRGPSFFAADMPAVPVGGEIFAFDRNEGGLVWKREVKNQRLLCQAFEHLPVLLMIDSDRQQKGGQNMWKVDLLALDKRSGEPVLDEPYYTTSTPFFHDLTVQPERHSIELTAYHTRLRLQASPVDSERPQPDARLQPDED